MSQLTTSISKNTLRYYRFAIRHELEKNEKLIRYLKECDVLDRPVIESLLSHVVMEESAGHFRRALDEIMEELNDRKNQPDRIQLVDLNTGKHELTISPEHIYQPPDMTDEFGNKKRPLPVLHPAIAAPIAINVHEKARISEAIEKAGPSGALSLQHLSEPESIVRTATKILLQIGYSVGKPETMSGGILIKFGEENAAHLQSINQKFHRAQMFGEILSKRVITELKSRNSTGCYIGEISPKRTAKKRWFEVTVYM